ncbi:MAG: Type II secretion system protein [Parcubacteria group bacterium GW2011_GWA1_47_8]|nr:MAG: Type II secretion system protein [Parcubacteria group bacterium GW2011_GWA1_47_8]KKW07629.1 MAG: Type II secretion system protein [Parcubacteria group bacterium GW2011_GWA2_49_16]
MPKFSYKAKEADGTETEGTADSRDRFTLASELRATGKNIVSVKELKEGGLSLMGVFNKMFSRVKAQELIDFCHNLSAMMGAGLSLSRALLILERQTKNQKFKDVLHSLSEDISKGNTMSSGMAKAPAIFSPLFVSMVRAGEESGSLSQSLKIVGDQVEKSNTLKKKIKGAMIYPTVVLSAMVIIATLMFIYVVPTLTATFKEVAADLPTSTKIIIGLSDFLSNHFLLGIVLVVVVVTAIVMILRTKGGHRLFEKGLFYLPIIGPLVKQSNAAQTTRTLSSLLSSGVSMVEAISITRDVVQNSFYKEVLVTAGERVQKGISLSSVFKEREDIYPMLVGEMIEVGEETGKLTDMLMNVAVFFENEVDMVTKNMTTIIEPILMVVIGGGVGFFAISMITPMYSVMSGI